MTTQIQLSKRNLESLLSALKENLKSEMTDDYMFNYYNSTNVNKSILNSVDEFIMSNDLTDIYSEWSSEIEEHEDDSVTWNNFRILVAENLAFLTLGDFSWGNIVENSDGSFEVPIGLKTYKMKVEEVDVVDESDFHFSYVSPRISIKCDDFNEDIYVDTGYNTVEWYREGMEFCMEFQNYDERQMEIKNQEIIEFVEQLFSKQLELPQKPIK